MINIPLSQEKVSLIDDSFAHLLNYKWHVNSNGYAVRKFTRGDNSKSEMRLHHAIIGFPLKNMEVDHINGNRLDNRLSNLRIVTHRQNTKNQPEHRGKIKKSSKFIGVYWYKRFNKWKAQIYLDGKQKHLGYFDNEQDANEAYSDALSKI